MRRLLPLLLILCLAAPAAQAANIVIVNIDSPGEGFNDPTPATPVGGNSGTTLGEQRLIVFQYAADIWGAMLPSAVTIRVNAKFDPLSCDASGGVLGSAGPTQVYRDFGGAEWPATWYHVALANRKAGSDLNGSTPEINATFNSSVDNNDNCLSGTNWYYGLDGNEGGDVELLPVVLHELAHGLGFSEFVDLQTGSLLGGYIDVYSRYLRDATTGKLWSAMNNAERINSAVNTDNLVWDGFAVNFAAPSFLEGAAVVIVNSPVAVAGTITNVGVAAFGPPLTSSPITADLVLVDDGSGVASDGCSPLVNAGAVSGKIALIDRGTCAFTDKVQNAENAGAIAVVVVNNTSGDPIDMGGVDPGLSIPSVMISQADGNDIKAQLGSGVNVTLVLDPNNIAGVDPATGKVKLYAPDPLQLGSSVSHFDVSATPNLLMEPAINQDLSSNVDLTKYQFEDIGWFEPRVTDTPEIPLARTQLKGNAPNPFNPSTTIRFELSRPERVKVAVYDVSGRLVRELADRNFPAGPSQVRWDGKDDGGRAVASGVYHYRFQAGDYEAVRPMVLLK